MKLERQSTSESLILFLGDCMGHFKSQWMKYMIPVTQLEPRSLPPKCLPHLRGCLPLFSGTVNSCSPFWTVALVGARYSCLPPECAERIYLQPQIFSEEWRRPRGSGFKWKCWAVMSLLSIGIRSCCIDWIRVQKVSYAAHVTDVQFVNPKQIEVHVVCRDVAFPVYVHGCTECAGVSPLTYPGNSFFSPAGFSVHKPFQE